MTIPKDSAVDATECPACGAHVVVGGNLMECAARCGWFIERGMSVRNEPVSDEEDSVKMEAKALQEDAAQTSLPNRARPSNTPDVLLPCPFCGRMPVVKEVSFSREVLAQAPEPSSYWWIGCEIDAQITGCGIGHSNINKATAIGKWNTRIHSDDERLAEQAAARICNVLGARYPTVEWPFRTITALIAETFNETQEASDSVYTSGLDLLDSSKSYFLCSACNTLTQLGGFSVEQMVTALAAKGLRHLPDCPIGGQNG